MTTATQTHTLHVLDKDLAEITWTPDDDAQARQAFADHKAEGYLAFRTQGADEGEVIKEFDPDAETIVMTRPFAGG